MQIDLKERTAVITGGSKGLGLAIAQRFAGLGAQVFIGEFTVDWNAVLSALRIALMQLLIQSINFSRQLIRGITSGAVK